MNYRVNQKIIEKKCDRCGHDKHINDNGALYCANCCWHPNRGKRYKGKECNKPAGKSRYKKRVPELIKCACGCGGTLEKLGRAKYIRGHIKYEAV